MGGKIATRKGPHVKYEKQLAAIDKRLAAATTANELGGLAREFHQGLESAFDWKCLPTGR